jgi:hypothetical protein
MGTRFESDASIGLSVACLRRAVTLSQCMVQCMALTFGGSFIFMMVLYIGKRYRLLADHHIANRRWLLILSQLVLLPYACIAATVMLLGRLREDFANEVAPGIRVGGLPFPFDRKRVIAGGTTAILNLCLEFPDLLGLRKDSALSYRRVPAVDGVALTDEQCRISTAWCMNELDCDRRLLIHCAKGHGRSATVAVAVLLARGFATDIEHGYSILRAARPGIRLGPRQLAVAARVGHALFGGSPNHGSDVEDH